MSGATTSLVATAISCRGCNKVKEPECLYNYSACNHFWCVECSNENEYCKTCGNNTLSVGRLVSGDKDLAQLVLLLSEGVKNDTQASDDHEDCLEETSKVKKAFDILLHEIKKSHSPSNFMCDKLMTRMKERGLDSINIHSKRAKLEDSYRTPRRESGKTPLIGSPSPSSSKKTRYSNSKTASNSLSQTPNSSSKTCATPIHMRGMVNQTTPVSPLLKNSRKVNRKGESTLHVAIKKKEEEIIEKLLDDGVHVNHQDFAGWTPLHDAVQGNMLATAELLLKRGAIVNAAGLENKTALHIAVDNADSDNAAMVDLLLEHGANPDAKDLYGQTPRTLSHADLEKNVESKSENEPKLFHEVVVSFFPSSPASSAMRDFVRKFKIKTETRISKATYVVDTENTRMTEFNWNVAQTIVKGAFIVTSKWCEESLSAGLIKEPWDYLVEPAWLPGLPLARKNCLLIRPGLFSGLSFFFGNGTLRSVPLRGVSIAVTDLKNLIQLCDGHVLKRAPDPEDAIERPTLPWHAAPGPLEKCFQIMIDFPPDYNMMPKYQMPHLKVLPITWLLDCILQFQLIDDLKSYQSIEYNF